MGQQVGTTAIVTGGSDGIGRAIAARVVAEGGQVLICGRDQGRLDVALEHIDPQRTGRGIARSADCREADQIDGLYDHAVERFGKVTAIVNNVGSSSRGPLMELGDDEITRDLELKLFSAIRLSRRAGRDMIERDEGGRIVNILAIAGKHPSAGTAPTSITRAAGIAFTKVLSKELAPHRVLVNAVCIGYIKSGQHRRRAEAAGRDLTEHYRQMVVDRSVPLGRIGEPEEAANLVNFLLSEEASYISGTAINVDGGASSAT